MFCPNPECPHRDGTNEAAEFRAGVTRCPDCGSALVESLPEAPSEAGLEDEKFVSVATFPDASALAFAQSLMDSAGIRYFIKGTHAQSTFGSIPLLRARLFVEPSRAQEARELIADMTVGSEPDVDTV